MITKKYYKLIRVSYEDQQYLTLTNTSGTTGGFSVAKYGSPYASNLEYSINGVDWTSYDFTNLPTVEVPVDGHIYLRGNNSDGFNGSIYQYWMLGLNVAHTVSGNLFSLRNADPTTFSAYTNVLDNEFNHLFSGDTNLINSENLITTQITSAGNRSFYMTFDHCSNLTKAPNFSGLTSVGYSCFEQAFYVCENLNTVYAPNVSAWGQPFSYWLEDAGTSATGTKTVYAPTGVEIPTDSWGGIAPGWTRVDY